MILVHPCECTSTTLSSTVRLYVMTKPIPTLSAAGMQSKVREYIAVTSKQHLGRFSAVFGHYYCMIHPSRAQQHIRTSISKTHYDCPGRVRIRDRRTFLRSSSGSLACVYLTCIYQLVSTDLSMPTCHTYMLLSDLWSAFGM